MFLWGGLQILPRFFGYPNELWRFDPQQRTWEMVSVTGDVPVGREAPTYFWDDANSRLYIFHGHNQSSPDALLGDAHVLRLGERRWEPLEITGPSPAPRWRASAAYDPRTGTGWMFGGWVDFGGRVTFNDTWRFDPNSQSWLKVCILPADQQVNVASP